MVSIVSVNSPNAGSMNYKQMDDDLLIQRMVLDQAWGDKQVLASAWKLTSWMGGHNTTSASKKPQWAIGDEESRTVTLSAGFILPDADGSKVQVTIDESYIPDNQLLHVYEDLGATYGVAEAIIRYRDSTGSESKRVQLTNSKGIYTENYRTFTTGATVTVLINCADYDGEVGAGVEIAPTFLDNAMMRSREAVQIGTHTHSDLLHADVSLAKQAAMKRRKIMRGMNEFLYKSNDSKVAEANFAGLGVMGGFDKFLRADNTPCVSAGGTTLTGLKGVRKLSQATGITSNMMDEYMVDFVKYGSNYEKMLFGSPQFINKFVQMGKQESGIYAGRFQLPGNDNYYVDMKFLDTAWGKLWLVPDDGAIGLNKTITDGTLTATGSDWGMVLDPTCVKMITHVADGKINKGVQSLKLIPVDTTANNNSKDVAEWDVTQTLMVTEPRACGYIALGAS